MYGDQDAAGKILQALDLDKDYWDEHVLKKVLSVKMLMRRYQRRAGGTGTELFPASHE